MDVMHFTEYTDRCLVHRDSALYTEVRYETRSQEAETSHTGFKVFHRCRVLSPVSTFLDRFGVFSPVWSFPHLFGVFFTPVTGFLHRYTGQTLHLFHRHIHRLCPHRPFTLYTGTDRHTFISSHLLLLRVILNRRHGDTRANKLFT